MPPTEFEINPFHYPKHPFKQRNTLPTIPTFSIPTSNRYSTLPSSLDDFEESSIVPPKSFKRSPSIFTETKFGKRYLCPWREPGYTSLIQQPLHFSGQDFQGIVDSGAAICTISPTTLNTLPAKNIHRLSRFEPFSIFLAANGPDPCCISQQVGLEFDILPNKSFLWRFFILPNSSNPYLLGLDWLKANNILIDTDNDKLLFPRKIKTPSLPKLNSDSFPLYSTKSISIQNIDIYMAVVPQFRQNIPSPSL